MRAIFNTDRSKEELEIERENIQLQKRNIEIDVKRACLEIASGFETKSVDELLNEAKKIYEFLK